ncbi:uncharacterized protein [Asterias amurensis]|uniref:uncharacterized protein n=1 Tax=Asterias amurensis TaxID=7602 RepID=UPI003AB7AC0F
MLQFRHSVLVSIAASVVWLNVRSESENGIRLTGGPATVPNAGRVEVWSPDVSEWIAVCDSEWDFKDAQVVCRELGFTGTGRVRRNSYFGDGNISNSSSVQYNCFGTEPSLSRCPKTVTAEKSCPAGNTAGVICTGPGYAGCYRDHGNVGNTFHNYTVKSNNMTIELCLSIARNGTDGMMNNGSTPLYAGLEDGDKCWYNLRNPNFVQRERSDSSCNKNCTGNADQICGGTNPGNNGRLSIYDVTLSYCDDPGLVPNGTVIHDHPVNEFYFGTIINVTCESGFHLQGAPSIQCLMSQPYGVAWNASLPQCLESPKTSESTTTTQETGQPSTIPTDMEHCQPNIGTFVGLGGAFLVFVVITVAVLISVCLKIRRGASKSTSDQSPSTTSNRDTGVNHYPSRNTYQEQITTSHNNESYDVHTIDDEEDEANNSHAVADDVTKRQSDGVGWEDNILYEPSYPSNPDYLQVT